MAKSCRALVIVMRVMGGSMMIALVAAFMPDSWLHAAVEKAEPTASVGPLVEYTARGWSAFYFMLGGLVWLFSTDLARYLPAIRWVASCYSLINGAFLAVLAWLWSSTDEWGWFVGAITFNVAMAFLFGVSMLRLARKLPDQRPTTAT